VAAAYGVELFEPAGHEHKGGEMIRAMTVLTLTIVGSCTAAFPADPPVTVNYQGVLRDAADKPRNGTFDMVFRFHDAAAGGNEILLDIHPVVAVNNGLFNVTLGGGTVVDGTGPGTYTSLEAVFRNHGSVWMGLTIGGELLFPRIKVESSPYALNAGSLQGRPASAFLDVSSNTQSKSGSLLVVSAADPALRADSSSGNYGQLGGSLFGDPIGVVGYGANTGGFFFNDVPSYSALGYGGRGIEAVGWGTGGAFENYNGGGRAYVGTGRTGIDAYGVYPSAAGSFTADGYTGLAQVGIGETGILARGDYDAGEFHGADGRSAYLGSSWIGTSGYFENFGVGGVFTYLAADGGFGLLTNGAKNFVQNHPSRADRSIVYTALEGPEAGTYTRGHATLRRAETRIALDPTFALTTDPDLGLTAIVTPRSAGADLYVVSVSTHELVVRTGSERDGALEFDYLVNGLRAGFENAPVIIRNSGFPSATVPDLDGSAARLASEPEDVRGSAPAARYSGSHDPREAGTGKTGAARLDGARALIAGINSTDHAAHALARPAPHEVGSEADAPAPGAASGPRLIDRLAAGPAAAPAHPPSPATPTPAAPDVVPAFSVAIDGMVEGGDVVANDAASPGLVKRADLAFDAGVIGVVAGRPGASFSGHAQLAPAGSVVFCKAEATTRPIGVNDLLVASSIPGHAMSGGAEPRQGTVIGKALEPLESGAGVIRILVMSR
jgi:hypothetical protein